jgi:hypothetical protein
VRLLGGSYSCESAIHVTHGVGAAAFVSLLCTWVVGRWSTWSRSTLKLSQRGPKILMASNLSRTTSGDQMCSCFCCVNRCNLLSLVEDKKTHKCIFSYFLQFYGQGIKVHTLKRLTKLLQMFLPKQNTGR